MRLQTARLEHTLLFAAGLGFLALLIASLLVLRLDPVMVLALCIGASTLVMLVVNPLVGIHVIVALLYCENALVTREGFTAMQAIGPVILGAWILNLLLRRKTPFMGVPLLLAVLLFLLWGSLSLLYAYDSTAALLRFLTFLQLSIFMLMCLSVLDNVRAITSVLWAMIWWSAAVTIIGLFNYATGIADMVTGPGENRNTFAMLLVLSAILAFLLSEQTKRPLLRTLLRFVLLPLYLIGLALTLSRGGYICLAVAWLALTYRMALARRIWPAVAMLLGIVLVTPFLPEAFYERVMSIVPAVSSQSDTFGQRVNIWEQGVQMVKAHPIVGVGLGNFHEMLVGVSRGRDLRVRIAPHSSYVGVAAEGGLVGLTLYLLMHVLALRAAIQTFQAGRRLGRSDLQMLAAAVESGILVVMTWSFSGNSETMKIIWLLFALAASLQTIAGRLEAADAPAAPAA